MIWDYSSLEIVVEDITEVDVSDLTIRYVFEATDFGEVIIGFTDSGVCCLEFVEEGRPMAVNSLSRRFKGARIEMASEQHKRPFMEAGATVHIWLHGTAFQRRVWRELMNIPFGRTISYGELSRRLGCPGGSRAVGNAVGHNPVSIIVPCHRLVRSDGSLGGYRWGAERKRAILDYESERLV